MCRASTSTLLTVCVQEQPRNELQTSQSYVLISVLAHTCTLHALAAQTVHVQQRGIEARYTMPGYGDVREKSGMQKVYSGATEGVVRSMRSGETKYMSAV